ncbi:MAG: preprotein translocase subunit YajC [Muribaculaceae bacterium]|jgi:preprotein translocase subunit YajC|uniref:preprotein translocase subunit YajC n=1 Tax=Bacteroidales TaxID=171549 RepID=UPI000E928B73|nr:MULTISPECIES: preprotein translocase subunit YajC [Bacteroidales]MBJ2197052.1 preprotein translocase subunit YajC [Muribaculaceae bacterium]ROS82469.1 preprotein translocase subunit YajC [Muribaculaceae bacterium Isolate-036 (Harlan)]HBY15925.1 preprotein translocase subunit YajC [Porphyromonadaceae bacterium]MCI9029201.1 preprotein translocase subunit YajC [Muribaculaceae bacterium]MCX4280852.1 preprotein translocase subunit YajC [Muribaculaceae bacterium]
MNLNSILLEAAAGQAGGGMSGIIMIVLMIVIFYFFMIRPQQKKQKELKKQREAMQNGDKVVTAGGIHGRVKEIRETTVIVEAAPGVSLKVDRGSVYPLVEEQPKK